jgi:hypothetical protein
MSDINPYQSPATYEDVVQATIVAEAWQPGEWVFRSGNQLVMHKLAKLPDRCVKSNQPADGQRLRRKLSWHHPLVFLALIFGLIGLLVYIILAVVLSKKATIDVGLSEEWFRKRRRAILIGWLSVLLGIAVLAGSIAIVVNPNCQAPWVGWGIPLGLAMFLGGAIYGLMASRMVAPARITEEYVWLKGVHPDYLADLPPWPNQP